MKKNRFYENNFLEDMTSMSHKYFVFLRLMKKYCNEVKRFLDFGCGAGSFMSAVKTQLGAGEVFGCDISIKAIDIVNKNHVGGGFVVDIDEKDLPFEDNFFDLIFCGEVIEHIYDVEHLLSELKRVCKKDGLVFFNHSEFGFVV